MEADRYNKPIRIVLCRYEFCKETIIWTDNLHSTIKYIREYGKDVRLKDIPFYVVDLTIPTRIIVKGYGESLSNITSDILGAVASAYFRYENSDSKELIDAHYLVSDLLDENEIIRIYGKRWDIEVFFKVCKSYLNLSRECNSLSYDAMTAHTAVVFTRYMMLSLESRESNDNRSLGELFLYFSDEMSDITWIQAFQMLLQMFRTMLTENTELSDEKISELVDAFINALPALLKTKLQAA